jgi:sugar phosphate isomerase/epimerase
MSYYRIITYFRKNISIMKLYTAGIIGAIALFFAHCGGEDEKTSTPQTDSIPATSNLDSWKIGPQMWSFRMFTFEQGLAKTDSAGLKNVEAFFGQPLGGGLKDSFGISMSAESRTALKKMLSDKGISITAMGVIRPETKEEWVKAFDLAKEFGLSYITSEPLKDQWDMIDSLAGVYQINIAIHDHPRPNAYWHPDSVLAAIKGHQHIGSCADVGHWARNGLDPVECLKKLEGHIYGVHLKDIKTFGDTKSEDTVVSKGIIDFPAIFRELKRQNFSGMFSIEHESNWMNNLPDIIYTAAYFKEQTEKIK